MMRKSRFSVPVIPHLGVLAVAILLASPFLRAQSEADLRQYFEGQVVEVKISMPATKDGIDLYPERPIPIDPDAHSNRLRQYGIALQPGDRVPVTLIKVKGKHLEFHLGGGGYGVAGDDTGYVETPTVPKTRREKDLDDLIKKETDKQKRRKLEEERDELRDAREREERLLKAFAAREREEKLARIQEIALNSGSRFNIRFDRDLTSTDLQSDRIIAALSEYVDFNPVDDRAGTGQSGDSAANPNVPGKLRKGLLRAEVVALFGDPAECASGKEGKLDVESCRFHSRDETVNVLFVEGVLVRYSVSSR